MPVLVLLVSTGEDEPAEHRTLSQEGGERSQAEEASE